MSTSAACPSTPRKQLSVSPGSPQTDLTAPRRLSLAICCFCGDVSGMLATLHLLLGVGFRPDFQYGVGPTDSDQKTLV
ncbi:unnamed protein product [Protopolystoma xenopodis]|uniref:Uncharacterized protein n=1 Tax=Protopolystoma xenopodis TaxID=117903 RepID=A0A448WQJ9_9PLAT|nr:unnamed protein product [Protopolystoma xenopodis]